MTDNDCWMRALSFAGLHRLLCAIHGASDHGLTASEIDALIRDRKIRITRQSSPPARTTLYHYRNTLFRLKALRRDGSIYRSNLLDPDVSALLASTPNPSGVEPQLSDTAREHFAALVLRNPQCVSVFFDLFLPVSSAHATVECFRTTAVPVGWVRRSSTDISLWNTQTHRQVHCTSPVSVAAVPYGIRYWARNELGLIDEFWSPSEAATIMFPIHRPPKSDAATLSLCDDTIRLILSWRTAGDWSSFSVSDLIERVCRDRRQPRTLLFRALDRLIAEWPHHTAPIATARSLATLSAASPKEEQLILRSYYRSIDGRYISHIRLHRNIIAPTT